MWIVLVILLAGLLFFLLRNRSTNNMDLGPLTDEIVEIVNDFLDASQNFYYLDEHFSGAISIYPDQRTPGPFVVTLMNSSFLSSLYDDSPRFLTNNPEMRKKYDLFLQRFGTCFVPSQGAFICQTRCTIGGSQAQKEKIKLALLQQIASRCPLAEVRGDIIYTKGVDPN